MIDRHVAIDMHELLETGPARALTTLHRSVRPTAVRSIELVADIEDVASVAAETVVVLSEGVAVGGWLVSAALRYAWERRAAAIVVPTASFTSTVVDLARRLDVTMLAADDDIAHVAIDLAVQIGMMRGVLHARVARLHDQLASAPTIDTLVADLARGLGGGAVRADVGGVTVASAGAQARAAVTVTGDVAGDHDEVGATIIAEVPARDVDVAGAAIRLASPLLRSMLRAAALREEHAAAGLLSMVALTGAAALHAASVPPRVDPATEGRSQCVFLHVTDQRQSRLLGSPIHHLWRRAHPRVPLARAQEGWFAMLPAHAESSRRVRVLPPGDLRRLLDVGVTIGVSRVGDGGGDAAALATQAWLAARLCPSGAGAPLWYDDIAGPMIERLAPTSLVLELVRSRYPLLLVDASSDEVLAAVAAYLDEAGSASRAAERLGLHRNTVQSRVRRAGDLGLVLGGDETLLIHLIAAAWPRARAAARADGQGKGPDDGRTDA